jgi:lipopolysaccharide export system protein LptC
MNAVVREADDVAAGSPERRRRFLDSLPNRRRLTGEQAAARTVLVKRLRIALPALAGVLILALFFNTRSGGGDEAFLEDFANLEATPEELKMANPRFAGVDDKGHPYDITADMALQAPGVREIVELVNPRAVTTGADVRTEVTADKGVLKTEENILDLSNGVTLNHSVGDTTYVFTTPAATVSISDETVHSTSGVEGSSESGTLRADGMRAYNNEGRTVFEGNVSMRIFPSKVKAAEEKREDDEGNQ